MSIQWGYKRQRYILIKLRILSWWNKSLSHKCIRNESKSTTALTKQRETAPSATSISKMWTCKAKDSRARTTTPITTSCRWTTWSRKFSSRDKARLWTKPRIISELASHSKCSELPAESVTSRRATWRVSAPKWPRAQATQIRTWQPLSSGCHFHLWIRRIGRMRMRGRTRYR